MVRVLSGSMVHARLMRSAIRPERPQLLLLLELRLTPNLTFQARITNSERTGCQVIQKEKPNSVAAASLAIPSHRASEYRDNNERDLCSLYPPPIRLTYNLYDVDSFLSSGSFRSPLPPPLSRSSPRSFCTLFGETNGHVDNSHRNVHGYFRLYNILINLQVVPDQNKRVYHRGISVTYL